MNGTKVLGTEFGEKLTELIDLIPDKTGQLRALSLVQWLIHDAIGSPRPPKPFWETDPRNHD